jgi:hypothetical protein
VPSRCVSFGGISAETGGFTATRRAIAEQSGIGTPVCLRSELAERRDYRESRERVSMVFGEDRIRRDLRRYHLAMRLIAHQARTGTICDWTGLTREKLKTLRRDWGVPQEARHRGPSPSSLAPFFRSPRVRSEASSIAILCCALGAVPRGKVSNAARVLPNLDRGERLC